MGGAERKGAGGSVRARRRSRKVRVLPAFHRDENTPFVSSNAATPFFIPLLAASSVSFVHLGANSFLYPTTHPPPPPPLCPLLFTRMNSFLRRRGPCSRDNERTLETKSIDDAGRSSSFNPHRAHWNPLVYHAEIKSLPAVAKSIIL